MKPQLLFLSVLATLGLQAGRLAEKPEKISFTENKGQVSDQNNKPRPDVLYSGNAGDMTFHLRNGGLSYQFTKIDSWKEEEDPKTRKKTKTPEFSTIYRLDMDWLNCNVSPLMQTDETLPGHSNYYLAACPDGVKNVKSYAGVTYRNLYDHIDLHFYEKNGALKYDYLVAAGADYRQIQLTVKGAQKISLSSMGELIITTPLGTIKEAAPLVTQDGKVLSSKWVIKNSVLSFEIMNLQPGKALVIDPLVRAWGTYYGNVYSEGLATSTDALNNVYMSGRAENSTLIATAGSHQSTCAGLSDAFLVKFNSAGLRAWGTYYGGNSDDRGYGCATDASGNVFVAGVTASPAGIATPGSYKPTFLGGWCNAFLVKFDATGARLWGTYYGEWGPDWGFGCATDASGNVYITGITSSTAGIGSAGSHQPAPGGLQDAFLAKFNPAGVRQWGTYYGGSLNDVGNDCATDAAGNIYMCGKSESGSTIATPGSHQPAYLGGDTDGFLVKFDAQGLRQWGTYYGTDAPVAGIDAVLSCATDPSGNIFVTGAVSSGTGSTLTPTPGSPSLIATPGCHQALPSGAQADAYLAKFDATGTRQWGTYYGSGGYAWSSATDLAGNIYVVGEAGFQPVTGFDTPGAFQSVFGGNGDAFMAKFNTAGVRQYGTLYGGAGFEVGSGCSVDALGNVYLTGLTSTSGGTVIATPGSYQPIYGTAPSNAGNAFLVQFSDCAVITSSAATHLNPLCYGGATGSATVNVSSLASPLTYSWVPAGGTSASASGLSAGNYSCIITNSCGASDTQSLTISQPPAVALQASASNSIICPGNGSTLTVNGSGGTGAIAYVWSGGTSGSGTSVAINPTATTIYSVTGTDANGCSATTAVTQTVNTCLSVGSIAENAYFSVYPNPASSQVTIELFQPGFVKLFDALGRLILMQQLVNEKAELNLDAYDNGIYFLQISQNGFVKTVRLIKE